jgi:hypothetical protein
MDICLCSLISWTAAGSRRSCRVRKYISILHASVERLEVQAKNQLPGYPGNTQVNVDLGQCMQLVQLNKRMVAGTGECYPRKRMFYFGKQA